MGMSMHASASRQEHAAPRMIQNADFWRRCASVARKVASKLEDDGAIARTLQIGKQCERRAREAKERRRKTR